MPLFRLGDIQDNPYFTAGAFEIHKRKIEALKDSMSRTGTWGGWMARIGPDGKPQQAYGHHRKRAAQELFGPDHTVDLVIDNISDADMIRMMADENATEWEHDAYCTINTVKAVVQAFATENVLLPEVADKTRIEYIRIAPSFRGGGQQVSPAQETDIKARKELYHQTRANPCAYTAQTVASFLGWLTENGSAKHNVIDSLDALEFIEEGIAKPSMFSGLSVEQLAALISEMRRRQESHLRVIRSAAKAVMNAQRRFEKASTDEERAEAEAELQTAQENLPDIEAIRNTAASDTATVAVRLSEQFRNGMLSARNVAQVRTAVSHIDNGTHDQASIDLNNLASRLVRIIDRTFTDEKKVVRDLKSVLARTEFVADETLSQLNQALHDASARFLQYAVNMPVETLQPTVTPIEAAPTPSEPELLPSEPEPEPEPVEAQTEPEPVEAPAEAPPEAPADGQTDEISAEPEPEPESEPLAAEPESPPVAPTPEVPDPYIRPQAPPQDAFSGRRSW